MKKLTTDLLALVFITLLLATSSAHASRQLASHNGCMNCHADTKYDAPTWPDPPVIQKPLEKSRGFFFWGL